VGIRYILGQRWQMGGQEAKIDFSLAESNLTPISMADVIWLPCLIVEDVSLTTLVDTESYLLNVQALQGLRALQGLVLVDREWSHKK
jgi:hypothetical protein